MTDWIFKSDFGTAPDDVSGMLLGLLLAFLCGHVVAWVYMYCHSGLSYSRTFVNALIVLCLIVALVMMIMSNNVMVAFGMMAVFAIVRFRNVLRDTLDTGYLLAAISLGMASGTKKFGTAVAGAAMFALMMCYLKWTSFGSRQRYDLVLNLHWGKPYGDISDVGLLLERHAQRSILASHRTTTNSDGTDLSYRLLLRDPSRAEELVTELRAIPGVSRIATLRAEDESEI